MGFINKFFVLINIIVILLTLSVYLNVFLEPSQFFIFPVLGLFYPILFFTNCFFILFWLFQDVKWIIPSALTLMIGWSQITGFIGLNGSPEKHSAKDLTIISYNTHYFLEARQEHQEKAGQVTTNYFANMDDLDILCFQEYYNKFDDHFLAKLKGFELIQYKNKRTVIFSKYPKIRYGQVDFGTRTNACIWADLLIDGDTVRVYSVHLKSSNISYEAGQMLDNIDLQERDTWKGAFDVLTKYRSTAVKRTEQTKLIKEHMADCKYPIILAGDFNEPPTSFTYHLMGDNMLDAFIEKGKGMTHTYAGRIPFLRIDYIMVSKNIEVLACETDDKVVFSDHYPIKAVVRLPR